MENKMANKKVFMAGILKENPAFISLLGLCPLLAVTSSLDTAIGMGLVFIIVICISSTLISLLRKIIPSEIRIAVFVIIVAAIVSVVEFVLHAYAYSIYASLGLFLSLIVVNCIVIGRAEGYAYKNNVLSSFLDALGMGIGYLLALLILAFCREFLSTGGVVLSNPVTGALIFDTKMIGLPKAYIDYLKDPLGYLKAGRPLSIPQFVYFRDLVTLKIFADPAGSFLTLGFIIAIINAIKIKKEKNKSKNVLKEEVSNG